jgi:hypothetical protein
MVFENFNGIARLAIVSINDSVRFKIRQQREVRAGDEIILGRQSPCQKKNPENQRKIYELHSHNISFILNPSRSRPVFRNGSRFSSQFLRHIIVIDRA